MPRWRDRRGNFRLIAKVSRCCQTRSRKGFLEAGMSAGRTRLVASFKTVVTISASRDGFAREQRCPFHFRVFPD